MESYEYIDLMRIVGGDVVKFEAAVEAIKAQIKSDKEASKND